MMRTRAAVRADAHYANRSKAVEEYTKTIERHESAALASTSTSPSLLFDLAASPSHVKLGSMRHLRVNVPSNPESTGDEVVTGDGHGHGHDVHGHDDVMFVLWPFEQNVFRIRKIKNIQRRRSAALAAVFGASEAAARLSGWALLRPAVIVRVVDDCRP
jgi:hypothetical protein